MRKLNPCMDCLNRTPYCHGKRPAYHNWAEEVRAEKKALRDASLADQVLRTSYVNYMQKAEPHKSIRMYIHK